MQNSRVIGESTEENTEKKYTDNKYKKSFFYHSVKRIIDIFCSVLGIVAMIPVFIVISILIKLDSKGKIVFSQVRVGKNGKIFMMYKFRSMIINAEELLDKLQDNNEMSGPMFKMKEDPRITKVGKFIRRTSIDELPQLFNVLKGEMSLVGPRPNLPREVAKFDENHRLKLLAKPGLTCYWQVMGRNEIGFEEWMKLDIKYVEERNILIDLTLIFKTFFILFGDRNAH